jgi:hypothetical protein
MPTSRPFAYNTGSNIAGTQQVGNIAIGTPTSGFTGSPRWWNGPDEDLGYVICQQVPSNTQPAPDGTTGSVGFFRSPLLTEASFIQISQIVSGNQTFTSGNNAKNWLNNNGYWTSWLYTYTYYRWQITNSKIYPPNANCVQASEFVFQLNGVDQSMAGVTVTNPNGNNPVGETAPNLVDGNLNTKALDLNFVTNGNVTNFIFQFSTAKSFNGYRWATANDEEGRDPKSWTIAGSNDGTNWTTLHTVSNFTATTARFTYQTAQTY